MRILCAVVVVVVAAVAVNHIILVDLLGTAERVGQILITH